MGMDATAVVAELADKARLAARTLIAATNKDRSEALNRIAEELQSSEIEILAANGEDMARAREEAMADSMQDRLLLTSARISDMAAGAIQVSKLESPLGKTLRENTLPMGFT